MAIVLIASEWGAASGGINAFNFGLARGLSAIQTGSVCCAVTSWSKAQKQDAANVGVRLVRVHGNSDGHPLPTCGKEIVRALADDEGADVVHLWVGHDLISGEAAVTAAREHGGTAALIHHSDYLSYVNIGGGKGPDATEKRLRQMRLFTAPGAVLFGVGPELSANAKVIGKAQASMLLPGFPDASGNFGPDDRLHAIIAGRFEAKTEKLKRPRLAVEAFAEAIRHADGDVRALNGATLVVLGVDAAGVSSGDLEAIAARRAGRHVNIIPAPFNPDPAAVVEHLVRSNLAIMPSVHEGFGLVGWEAIGAAVPLIVGRGTGLLSALESLVGGRATGCLHAVDINGGASELNDVATAIRKVARDLPKARKDARDLRAMLKAEYGCTWENTARALLEGLAAVGKPIPYPCRGGAAPQLGAAWSKPRPQNYFPQCAELSLDVGQGASSASFELVAELRFGIQDLAHEDLEAEIDVKRVEIRVTSEQGRIVGHRLGDRAPDSAGIEARAGGIWVLRPPEGMSRMANKALGDETLCRIENPPGVTGQARVEITTTRRDIHCSIRTPSRKLKRTTERIMALFLKDAILKQESGHVLLSVAEVKEAPHA